MNLIKDKEFGGERPLFGLSDTRLEHITITDGESGIKFCRNIECDDSRFYGKYPWWHVDGSHITNCYVELHDGTYPFMFSEDIYVDGLKSDSKYVFQYCHNVEIHHARITTKDSFWECDNVTVYDSELDGEYLGWHSSNVRLVRCHISGEQPLCYMDHVTLEDCTFDAACDRAFEDSSHIDARISGAITEVKNPVSGHIVADRIDRITYDGYARGHDCRIETTKQ